MHVSLSYDGLPFPLASGHSEHNGLARSVPQLFRCIKVWKYTEQQV